VGIEKLLDLGLANLISHPERAALIQVLFLQEEADSQFQSNQNP
jgi:hypothetical protein